MGSVSPVSHTFEELAPDAIRGLELCFVAAAHARGWDSSIASVERSPLQSSSYRTERVVVGFASGDVLECFLKDFGTSAFAKTDMRRRRERELFFYRDVFPRGELGLPAFLGALWDEELNLLLLEFVDGVPLRWCDLDVWHEAAGWLGRFQTAVSERLPELRGADRFKEHSREYFEKIARRTSEESAHFGRDVAADVGRAVPIYLQLTKEFMNDPQTLVHGGFRPRHVLVDPGRSPVRICPTDWEIAAFGSCLYDLAALADGFEGPALEPFLDRFLAEARWLDHSPPGLRDLERALAAHKMHWTMKWIANARVRGAAGEHVRELARSLVPAVEA